MRALGLSPNQPEVRKSSLFSLDLRCDEDIRALGEKVAT
jgi:hypothetical protein